MVFKTIDTKDITANVDIGSGYCAIYEFSSKKKGVGNAERFVREMKKKHGTVSVIGMGRHPTDLSWKFWVHMYEKSLIDYMEDDEGRVQILNGEIVDAQELF